MYCPPFMMLSPQKDLKEAQSALQVAGGTKQIKTSWIPIFLNYTWSMSCLCLSFFSPFQLAGLLICCYIFVRRDLWKRIDEDKKSAYTYFDSLWFNMYNSGQNKSNVLKWIKAKKIFSRQYVFVPIVCW